MISFDSATAREFEKKQLKKKNIIVLTEMISSLLWVIFIFSAILCRTESVSGRLYIFALLFVVISGGLWIYRTYYQGIEGQNSAADNTARKILLNELCSDSAVMQLSSLAAKQQRFTDRAYVMMYLADTYAYRGQFDDAFRTMFSIDVTFFREHPTTALVYYNELINFYEKTGDLESIIGVYNDAQYYIEACAEKCYETYRFSRGMWASWQRAMGNNSFYLENHEDEINTKRAAVQTGKLNKNRAYLFFFGVNLLELAEEMYRMGERERAKALCVESLMYFGENPYYYGRAVSLKQRIEEESRLGNNS